MDMIAKTLFTPNQTGEGDSKNLLSNNWNAKFPKPSVSALHRFSELVALSHFKHFLKTKILLPLPFCRKITEKFIVVSSYICMAFHWLKGIFHSASAKLKLHLLLRLCLPDDKPERHFFFMVQYVHISENNEFSANNRLTFNENSIYQHWPEIHLTHTLVNVPVILNCCCLQKLCLEGPMKSASLPLCRL